MRMECLNDKGQQEPGTFVLPTTNSHENVRTQIPKNEGHTSPWYIPQTIPHRDIPRTTRNVMGEMSQWLLLCGEICPRGFPDRIPISVIIKFNDDFSCGLETFHRPPSPRTSVGITHQLCWLLTGEVVRQYRLAWLFTFLSACMLLLWLVSLKIEYLQSNPKNVNLDFNFNATLPFPAVTICNQSPFRYSFDNCLLFIIMAARSGDWRTLCFANVYIFTYVCIFFLEARSRETLHYTYLRQIFTWW